MKPFQFGVAVAVLVSASCFSALAQITSIPQTYNFAPFGTTTVVLNNVPANPTNCGLPGMPNTCQPSFLPLSAFAGAADLNSLTGQVNAMNAAQSVMNEKLLNLAAVSAALKDAVPNEGDRFAIRLNLGGFQDHTAGGISAAARLNDSMRLSASYGQAGEQSLYNAGLNFSFN